MEKSSDLLNKILDFFQNATMERVLLLSGLALVLFGVVGQVYGFGPVLPGQEWVLIVLGTLLMPAAVALYLLDRNDRVAAALFGAGGLIVATVLMVVFLLADPPVELASFTATPSPPPATVTRLSPTPSATPSISPSNTPTPTATPLPPTPSATASSTPPVLTSTATPSPTHSPTTTASPAQLMTPTPIIHTIGVEETLKTISQRHYGRPDRDEEICVANRARLNNNCVPVIGRDLHIPPLTPNQTLPPQFFHFLYTETLPYVVQIGDILSNIAVKFYSGREYLWPEICVANRATIGSDCNSINPDLVLQVPLLIPTATPTPSATASPTTTFTASPTETEAPAATESPASTATASPTETTSLETATPEP